MQVYFNAQLHADIVDWPVYMRRALELAGRVILAAPNPRVGCVIVADGNIVGEGWHSGAGQAHAEVVALKQAATKAQSATAFVTLEPCSHIGRTGPCADALINAGISQVVIAVADPNPVVSGEGIRKLEAAGIKVSQLADFEQDAIAINRGYFKRRLQGRPFVRCKMAMSLDGRTALANGDSKWITGPSSRADVQLLRASSCAVITGSGTVMADDPALTVRAPELPLTDEARTLNALALSKQPMRVVLDSAVRTSPAAKLVTEPGQVLLYALADTELHAVYPDNVTVKAVDGVQHQVSLVSVLESLASEYECNDVLVEAGAILSTAFITAGLVDELVVYIAPKMLGMDGRALVNIGGVQSLADSLEFSVTDVRVIHNTPLSPSMSGASDIRVTLVPRVAAET